MLPCVVSSRTTLLLLTTAPPVGKTISAFHSQGHVSQSNTGSRLRQTKTTPPQPSAGGGGSFFLLSERSPDGAHQEARHLDFPGSRPVLAAALGLPDPSGKGILAGSHWTPGLGTLKASSPVLPSGTQVRTFKALGPVPAHRLSPSHI